RVDISDSYVGGVVDMGLILQPNLAFRYMNNCNIKDFSDYINTGVLLMNLDLMRKDQLIEKFLFDMVHEDNPWLDQDVINRICHGRIHLLDWTFNHIVGFTDEEYRWQCGESGRTGQGEIYHWAGLNKPWYNYAFRQAEIWWERAKEALEPWVYQELYDVADRCMRQAFFSRIAEQCRGRDEIVIAGFSDHGIRVMRYLRQCGVTGKIIFCDNDKLKEKMHLMGCLVLSVEKAADTYRDAVWINAIQNERDKINKQLGNLGIPLSQIVEYHAVNSEYYLGLSRKYMRKGMEERVYLQG
ncbi:MAG TPA: hypothetical protein DF613_01135, partial [Lachnospiraceae bacterium]|nr:hypothetical protein [Lachnospiraceae bacterium]